MRTSCTKVFSRPFSPVKVRFKETEPITFVLSPVHEEIKILGNLVNSKSSKPGIFFKTLL